jgi:hypothetical protein
MDLTYRLLNSLRCAPKEDRSTVSQLLFEWKSSFSLRWYQQYYEKPGASLCDVWGLLFLFVEFPDENVNIAAFNCVGALLVSLSPFCCDVLIETFRASVSQLPVLPNTSITVITTFIFLTHKIGPHRIPRFIEEVPVVHHFGTDMKQFIKIGRAHV